MLALLLLPFSFLSQAQEVENDVQYRLGAEINYKIVKGLKLSVEPQVRFKDDFSVNRYQLEGGLRYKTFGFLYWGTSYRLIIKPVDIFETEKYGKYSFSLMAKESFDRFTPALRLRYSNYADDDSDENAFLRYKASLKYDIKDCKITPNIALEAFQELEDNHLYKMRYTAGITYKLKQDNYIDLTYKLDYYNLEYRNRHIIGLSYKYDF